MSLLPWSSDWQSATTFLAHLALRSFFVLFKWLSDRTHFSSPEKYELACYGTFRLLSFAERTLPDISQFPKQLPPTNHFRFSRQWKLLAFLLETKDSNPIEQHLSLVQQGHLLYCRGQNDDAAAAYRSANLPGVLPLLLLSIMSYNLRHALDIVNAQLDKYDVVWFFNMVTTAEVACLEMAEL